MSFLVGSNPYEARQSCASLEFNGQEQKKGEATLVGSVALTVIEEGKVEDKTKLKSKFDDLMKEYRRVVHARALDTHPSIKSEWDKLFQFAEQHPEFQPRLPKELGYPQVLVHLSKHPKNNKTSCVPSCVIL